MDQFTNRALATWPTREDTQPNGIPTDGATADDLLSDDSEDEDKAVDSSGWQPELAALILPSFLGHEICRASKHEDAVQKEKTLRMGQANDALHGLRVSLSRKAIMFRGLQDATSKVKRNRSWDQIKATTGSARHHVRIYLRARQALINLGATAGAHSVPIHDSITDNTMTICP
jgi:hypothetical protein